MAEAAAAVARGGRRPRTGILIREVLSRTANPISIHDVYTWAKTLYRDYFPRERPPTYERFRTYIWVLKRLGLVEIVGEAPASRPHLSNRHLIALTPFGASPDSEPYWLDPWGAFYRGERPPPPGAPPRGGGGGGGFGPRPPSGGAAAPRTERRGRRRREKKRETGAREEAERLRTGEASPEELVERSLSGALNLREAGALLALMLQRDFAGTYAALKRAAGAAGLEAVDALLQAIGEAGGGTVLEAARGYLENEVEAGRLQRETVETLLLAAETLPSPGERAYSLLAMMLESGV